MAGRLQFLPLTSAIDIGFWFELSKRKLEEFRLDTKARDVVGFYGFANDPAVPPLLHITKDAFSPVSALTSPLQVPIPGRLLVFNTLEEFKQMDKDAVLAEGSRLVGAEGHRNSFVLVTYPDLKNYLFYYWVAFPVRIFDPVTYEAKLVPEVVDEEALKQALSRAVETGKWKEYEGFVGVNTSDMSLFPVQADSPADMVLYLDPASRSDLPSAIPRNFLVQRSRFLPQSKLVLMALKDGITSNPRLITFTHSRIFLITLPNYPASEEFVGWEQNERGKLGPKAADLRPHMDPIALANSAVDLNLKLMRWRLVPELNLELIARQKCLLLGAGTLGCGIARGLMAWGVRKITLVDSGKVAYSNPVRQNLYSFEDCKAQRPKAPAAAEALTRVSPGVDAAGVQLQIPMPGHTISGREAAVEQDFNQLSALIQAHDVVFLLTDSRESRWLPTVLASLHSKICLTAALGFETFLVMRHGASVLQEQKERLGCYFCNDVVAPRNSLVDRTLDQQCTVTRPGVAGLSAAVAVELLVSLLHHPEQAAAPSDATTPLGGVPHQIRGLLSAFEQNAYRGRAFSKCTACSLPVLESLQQQGFPFLRSVCEDPETLERLLGLVQPDEDYLDAIIELD